MTPFWYIFHCNNGSREGKCSMLLIVPGIKIPFSEIQLNYVRSSGPGGQNVNKVNSKAVLRWNILSSPSLTEIMRARLMSKLANKITSEGEIIFSSDRFRDQGRNRDDCLEKLRICLTNAAEVPKIRKKVQPSRSSQRRVKENKSRQSQKKHLRRSPSHDE